MNEEKGEEAAREAKMSRYELEGEVNPCWVVGRGTVVSAVLCVL